MMELTVYLAGGEIDHRIGSEEDATNLFAHDNVLAIEVDSEFGPELLLS